MNVPALISEQYRALQMALHTDPQYGVASLSYAPTVAALMRKMNATELLDYGAGKGHLGVALQKELNRPLIIHHYDPAIAQWAAPPDPCRFVASIDVLEHIEPELLEHVLDDLKRVTIGIGFYTVHTGPAIKTLADGRNAHLTQQLSRWWLPKFQERWELLGFNRDSTTGFYVIVKAIT